MTEIETLHTLESRVEALLKTYLPQDIWVIFDIDMTLIQPDHPAVSYPSLKQYIKTYKSIMDELTPVQKDTISTLISQDFPQKWVETDTPKVLKDLHQKGVRVLALTASLAGKVQRFPEEMIVRRHQQLQDMGFAFSNLFAIPQALQFSTLQKHADGYPAFYKGILSSNGEAVTSKSSVLVAFLQYLKIHDPAAYPKVILFVDDKKKHVVDVDSALHAYDSHLHLESFSYTGAYDYLPYSISEEEFKTLWEELALRAAE